VLRITYSAVDRSVVIC